MDTSVSCLFFGFMSLLRILLMPYGNPTFPADTSGNAIDGYPNALDSNAFGQVLPGTFLGGNANGTPFFQYPVLASSVAQGAAFTGNVTSGSNGTFQDTSAGGTQNEIFLAGGVYLIGYSAHLSIASATPGIQTRARLFNVTTGAVVPNSEATGPTTQVANLTNEAQVTWSQPVTIAANTTLRQEIEWTNGAVGSGVPTSFNLNNGSGGRSYLTAIRVGN
jgi:hypothetical protein